MGRSDRPPHVSDARGVRAARVVRTIHAAAGVIFTVLLLALLYEGVVGRISIVSWIAVGLFLVEGGILIANGWRCPLTSIAERLGAARGRVTDLFLPAWIADRAFQIYGALFALGLVLFLVRMLM